MQAGESGDVGKSHLYCQGVDENWNSPPSPSPFSQAKATAAGNQPADTEMKDEQKNDVAGGQPQVQAEA